MIVANVVIAASGAWRQLSATHGCNGTAVAQLSAGAAFRYTFVSMGASSPVQPIATRQMIYHHGGEPMSGIPVCECNGFVLCFTLSSITWTLA